jgi:nanoRNase/pAp phosphatase (c-di-AMP/oligoRNAs hydrolase)
MVSKYLELSDLLHNITPKSKIAVELHQVPDPDTVGAGLLISEVLKKHGHEPTMTHAGFISHPENRLLVQKLTVHLTNYSTNGISHHPEKLPSHYDYFFFVDHSGPNSLWFEEEKIHKPILGVIDHHDIGGRKVSSLFSDYRAVGAVSSIAAEYLVDGAEELFNPHQLERICTALFFGLMKDTHDLRKGVSALDRRMHEYLYPLADRTLIDGIEAIEWPHSWMTYYGKAISNRETRHHITVASVGSIEPRNRDVIPVSADTLIKEQGVETVFVIGIQPEYIDVSIRCKDENYNFRDIKQRFPEGKSGGRKGAGRLRLPLDFGGNGSARPQEENILKYIKGRIYHTDAPKHQ